MKKLILIATVIFMSVVMSSCKEDEVAPMIWKFSSYDKEAVSAVYTPEYYNQVAIEANSDYNGEITITCTNYPNLSIDAYTNEGTFACEEAGFSIAKIDGRTLKIVFTPVSNVGEDGIYTYISVSGNNNKERNTTNMSIARLQEKK
ncbi:MAG: hypothetical protein K2I08_11675 [Muribaculaceae bacterium]|nr:hypothetical protein [Muribaculaceae bacterium]